MASRSLGTLTLDLIARIGGFTGPLDQAGRIADKRMRQIEKGAKQLGKAIGIAFTAAATAIAAGVKSAIDQADALNDLNQRLGITAEALSGWAYAAKQTGTDIDGLSIGLKKLSKNMAAALDADSSQGKLFAALDIKPIDEATGKLKSLEQVLPEIADKFKGLKDETLEAALAQELFGKSGTDLLEFLNLGSGGIEEMRAKLRELGGELSQGTLSAADAFNDKLNDLHTATNAMFTALAADLLPQLTELTGRMIEATKDGSNLRQNLGNLAGIVSYLGEAAGAVADSVRALTSAMIGLYNVADNLSKLNPGRALGEWIAGKFGANTGDSLAENWREAKVAAEQAGEAFTQADVAAAKSLAGFGKGIRGGGGKGFGGASGAGTPIDPKALYDLLNNPTGAPKGAKGGKSDAEREAEQLEEAIKRMNAQMAEQIALFGQTSEVAKVRYDLENGELAKATAAQKEELLLKAAKLDLLNQEKEETERLNKLEEERRETVDRAHEALADTLSDMQFELDLMGKSNAERIAEIELRRIGLGLSAEEAAAARVALTAAAEQLEAMHEQVGRMDELRSASDDLWVSFADGIGNGIEGLKDFGNAFADQLKRMSAEYLSSALFGARGTAGGGLLGGLFSSIFGGFGGFGGGGSSGFGNPSLDLSAWTAAGYANGTDYAPGGLAWVGEDGPELMNVPRGAQIIPHGESMAMAAGGVTQIFNQTYQAPTEARTRAQVASDIGVATRRANSRNGVKA